MNLSKFLETSLNENQRVQITHAIDSGGFDPANEDYDNWLEFWEGHVNDSIKAKFMKGIKDPVGAHVIDKDCDVYIMPCENDENFQQGQLGAQLDRLYLSVPKEALVKVFKSNSKAGSVTWEEFIKQNQPLCDEMKKMKDSKFEKRW